MKKRSGELGTLWSGLLVMSFPQPFPPHCMHDEKSLTDPRSSTGPQMKAFLGLQEQTKVLHGAAGRSLVGVKKIPFPHQMHCPCSLHLLQLDCCRLDPQYPDG